jgi:hypothetical protein
MDVLKQQEKMEKLVTKTLVILPKFFFFKSFDNFVK